MAFLNNSLKDSFKTLAPTSKPSKPRGRPPKNRIPSPVRIPDMSPIGDKFSPFRTSSPSTPTTIQRTPDNEERMISPVVPITPENSDRESSPEPESSPKREEDKDIVSILEDNYFTILRFIEDDRKRLVYAICYDPNGQITFVELDISSTSSTKNYNTVTLEKQDFLEFAYSYKEYIRNKLSGEMYGVVLVNSGNYCFMTKVDNGDVVENYYGDLDSETNEDLNCYCVVRISEIIEDPVITLKYIGITYEMIQQHQLLMNKDSFSGAMEEITKLSSYFKEFDTTYRLFTNSLLTDWEVLSNICSDYIDKMENDTLTEDEDDKFKTVSGNLFARFQAFNNISNILSKIRDIPKEISSVKTKIKESIESFNKDYDRLSEKVLEQSEIDILF